MPEFEEENTTASQSQHYTPSTDASKKPRTRRRSGGFKTEVANTSPANIGEVSAAEAIKEEKLSGSAKPAAKSERPEPKERREKAPRQKRETKEPKEPRRETNPQPSPETLAAIASVEAKIAERKAERDARRAEREKNKPAKSEKKPQNKQSKNKPAPKKQQKGLLASILSIFGLGPKEEPAKKKGGKNNRGGKGRGGRPQGKGGNRGGGGQNRGRGNGGRGQGRKRGGKGPRKSTRRTNEKVVS